MSNTAGQSGDGPSPVDAEAWKATADRFRVENGKLRAEVAELRGYLGQIDGTRRELTRAVNGNALGIIKATTAHAETKAQRDELLAALKDVEIVINPRDMGGISMHEWGSRLRVATSTILAVIAKAEGRT